MGKRANKDIEKRTAGTPASKAHERNWVTVLRKHKAERSGNPPAAVPPAAPPAKKQAE